MHPPAIAAWHRLIETRDPSGLHALIADGCVFQSPAVHAPQVGKEVTVKYLSAAIETLGGPDFRYVEQWLAPRSAVLEFMTRLDGMELNGVDIIHWDNSDQITSFRVMVRPLKGLMALIPAMAAKLGLGASA